MAIADWRSLRETDAIWNNFNLTKEEIDFIKKSVSHSPKVGLDLENSACVLNSTKQGEALTAEWGTDSGAEPLNPQILYSAIPPQRANSPILKGRRRFTSLAALDSPSVASPDHPYGSEINKLSQKFTDGEEARKKWAFSINSKEVNPKTSFKVEDFDKLCGNKFEKRAVIQLEDNEESSSCLKALVILGQEES